MTSQLEQAKAKADAAWDAFEAARAADSRASHRAEVARVRCKTSWSHWMDANTAYLAMLKALKDSL